MSHKPDNARNHEREKAGLKFLLSENPDLVLPTSDEKRSLLRLLELSTRRMRSFDLVRLNVPTIDHIASREDFSLVEVKVTEKELPNFPTGFFFGMTANEEDLLRKLEDSFILCLVSINEKSRRYIFLSYEDLQKRIKHKRTQYQINL